MKILPFSWVFFIYFCWILLSLEIDGVSGQCPRDQQKLLLELRDSLLPKARESKKLVQWSSNSSFEGATCEEGRVTGLDLSNESISGGIEGSTLFALKFLKRLDLSYNNFNSTIPARIGDLASLNYLNLSNAGFVGQVPISISNLTRLVTLDLSVLLYLQTSSLKLENPNLRMVIEKLGELEKLYLDGINISASGKEWGQALSSSLPKLRELSLSNCYLSGPIDDSLAKLPHLSLIRLVGNNLSASVPEFFANYSNLTSLHLSACELNGTFPEKIFQVPTLQILAAANNQLLHGSLPASMDNPRNLSRLDLSDCQFNGTLPKSMEKLTQLVYLDLSRNNFTGPVPSFRMSKNLSQIILSHNDFTGEIPSSYWEGLMKLVTVDLQNNSFIGSVPSSLFALPSLKQIQLSDNQFSGQLDELPNPSSSMLDTIDLSSNRLEGSIPPSIFEIRNLSFLSLSSNKLNGTVHLDMIQGLHNLAFLDLSYNDLFVNGIGNDSTLSTFLSIRTLKLASCKLRKFPYLKNQSKLVYLDLSDNQIDGKVPNWIWEVGKGSLSYANFSRNKLKGMQEPYSLPNTLTILDLHLNQFQGKIPLPPPFATYVDFSSNNFTSSIPYGIGINLSITIFFSLSNNGLTGRIPESICSASYLKVLDLSNNSLSGDIPECLTVMSQSLGVLNLRKNSFTGLIPNAFPVNCTLETLDLNGNSLGGLIPKSLANCTRLEVLNLGNNRLDDKYPCSLKVISTLRVLVLRSNKFHGSIGCPKTDGAWPKVQIVDLAHNNFNGTLPSKFIPRWQAMLEDMDEKQSKLHHLRYEFLQLSQSRYYQDTVTVTAKGLEMNLVKILTLFTSVDLSSNHFSGPISEEFGRLKALYLLNLSNNALTGVIPSSIGNLRQLESLDFSRNNLSGSIPPSLSSLNFLSYLNLSFNQLVGSIPTGNQLQTFSADSYVGNEGLCGSPLSNSCSNTNESRSDKTNFQQGIEFDWQSIYTGVGFGVGAGAIVALLMIWEEGRNWFDDSIDKILLVILPKLGYVYTTRHEWDNEDDEEEEADEDDEEEEEEEADEDEEEEEAEFGGLQGHYCVFCSKLDIRRKRVIHDPKCTCHSSSLVSSSSSSFSTTSSSSSP
ncbi:hypothetical protein UlMin_000955 [Ulmus minor]